MYALQSISYMFMMPLTGVPCAALMITSYHRMFGNPKIGLFTPSLFTEIVSAWILGYIFWIALKGSLKARNEVKAHINGEKN